MKFNIKLPQQYSPKVRLLLHIFGFILGILIGAMLIFNVLFLSKVLPHGGI